MLQFREGAAFGKHSHGEHVPEEEYDDHETHKKEGHEDEHADNHDDHAQGDPHVWLDSQNAIAWAYVIADALGAEDPQNALAYDANAQVFTQRITGVSDKIMKQL